MSKAVVILLRATPEENDPWIKTFTGTKWLATFKQVLDFAWINQRELSNHLHNADSFHGLILTSPRAVEAIQNLQESKNDLLEPWKVKPAWVVGTRTASLLRSMDFKYVLGEQAGNAGKLAQEIINKAAQGDRQLLFPCGNLKLEELPSRLTAANVAFQNVTVYETVRSAALDDAWTEPAPQAVVFFSPSGVRFALDEIRKQWGDLEDIVLISLGPSTAEAMIKAGLKVSGIASKPNPEEVLKVLQNLTS